jgi:hypothetical protein
MLIARPMMCQPQVLLKDKMNLLLLLLPLAVISKAAGWAAGATFLLALLPLCSLAEVRCCSKHGASSRAQSTQEDLI